MNKTVELVNEWAAFEAKHPEGEIDDFCRYYLTHSRQKQNTEQLFNGDGLPPRPDLALSKLMGRIIRIFSVYAEEAIKTVGLKRPEEFYFLSSIVRMKNPRKTEVIYNNIAELSTGLSLLEQLKKQGLIEETDDAEDKRSKRLTITPEGEKVLHQCYEKFAKVGDIIFGEMEEEDARLCIQLLQPIDTKHVAKWQHYKGKPFEESYVQLMDELHLAKKNRE